MPKKITLLKFLLSVAVAACCGAALADDDKPFAEPTDIKQLTPASVADLHLTQKIMIDRLRDAMTPGEKLGHQGSGWLCHKVNWYYSKTNPNWFSENIKKAMTGELKKYGYRMYDANEGSLYASDVSNAPDFRIGATFRKYNMELCLDDKKYTGWVRVVVDWEVFSEKEQKVVLQKTTDGYVHADTGVEAIWGVAFQGAVDNLIGLPEFSAAIQGVAAPTATAATAPAAATPNAPAAALGAGEVDSGTPANVAYPVDPMQKKAAAAVPAPQAASAAPVPAPAHGELVLTASKAPAGGAQKEQNKLRAAVVTLEAIAGQGSGFYIDQSGYLLTDYHVVKGAKYVKVKFSNGDKLVGEIVRVNEPRDVALVKTPAVDVALAIRPDALDVGEDVYAIGTPVGLESTMTHGVLSADRTVQGKHWLQSDVSVTVGNSGGPLLDKEGRVIGLSAAGGGDIVTKGINFFVPVQDALKVLSVVVK
ncbi:MAG: trypsin-like peptidase domain-containing protein [Burkholderiaceae bacterium]|nr:trypsin-like peptidase domain-containing protein [Burkholderiaceae bacterium]